MKDLEELAIAYPTRDWRIATVGDVAQVKGGKRLPKGEKFAETVTPFPYIRVTDFVGFCVDTSDIRYLRPETQAAIRRYTISMNDVYISIAGSIGITGMIPSELDGANLTENAAKLVVNHELVDTRFLMYFLSSEIAQREIRGQTVKNAQPKLALARVASIKIPLPPLPEQRKMARVLGVVQRAMEQQERLLLLTAELKKALLHNLFTEGLRGEPQKQTEIGPVPESWDIKPLGDYLTEAQYGISVKGAETGRHPVLRMTNQQQGRISDANLRYVELTPAQFAKFRVERQDILFNRTNSLELVGRTAIFDIEGDFVFASYLIRLRTDSTRLRPSFLNHHFNWDETQVRLKSIATRAVSQSNISAMRLRGFPIPLPSPEEQDEIVTNVDCLDRKLAVHRGKHAALTALFRTLLHQLMTAQIRVHDLDLDGVLSQVEREFGDRVSPKLQ
jgi:type I restriction enzyme S subunit